MHHAENFSGVLTLNPLPPTPLIPTKQRLPEQVSVTTLCKYVHAESNERTLKRTSKIYFYKDTTEPQEAGLRTWNESGSDRPVVSSFHRLRKLQGSAPDSKIVLSPMFYAYTHFGSALYLFVYKLYLFHSQKRLESRALAAAPRHRPWRNSSFRLAPRGA